MKQTLITLAALLLLPVGAHLMSAAPSAPALDTFEQRRQWVFDIVTADPKAWIKTNKQEANTFYAAEAFFAKGLNDKGRELASEGYRYWTANPKPNFDGNTTDDRTKMRVVDFFRLWPAMDCYVRYKDRLDEETKAAFKKFMTSIDFYDYHATPNLNMMMWTARLLGEQEWGVDAFVPLAHESVSTYKPDPNISFRDGLLEKLTDIARTGGPEYASRPYGTANLAPVLTLAQLSKDPEIRLRARIAHESVLARYAAVWLRGGLILTSARSYPDGFNDPVGIAAYLWTFLGGDLLSSDKLITEQALEAAVLGEGVPDLLQHIARERAQPYEAHNRFAERSSGRQISWIDADYGVFSESFHTKPRPFPQTYPFGVRWIVPDSTHDTFLWFSVPVLDDPGHIRISHPHGFDLSAQSTFQHDGSILYVVNTEPGGKPVLYPYGLCHVPGGALAVLDESKTAGRVFLHYPGVLIALSATKPFIWDRKAPLRMRNSTLPPDPSDSEFRIDGPLFAAAIETAPVREFPGASPEARLAAFRNALVAKSKVELIAGNRLGGRYTNRNAVVIQREFAGPASAGGKPVDFDTWPVAASKWVNQATKETPLIVTDGKTIRTYDFQQWQIVDGPAKPSK